MSSNLARAKATPLTGLKGHSAGIKASCPRTLLHPVSQSFRYLATTSASAFVRTLRLRFTDLLRLLALLANFANHDPLSPPAIYTDPTMSDYVNQDMQLARPDDFDAQLASFTDFDSIDWTSFDEANMQQPYINAIMPDNVNSEMQLPPVDWTALQEEVMSDPWMVGFIDWTGRLDQEQGAEAVPGIW